MLDYRKRKYRKNYNSYYEINVNPLLGAFILFICVCSAIVGFINKNKEIIIITFFVLLLISLLIFILKNEIKLNKKIIYIKMKKSQLYQNIINLNNDYKFDELGIFYDAYNVNKRSLLKISNIDEYLMMTIENKYEELVDYKKKYDDLKKNYDDYNKKYNSLFKYIDENESKKLKLSKKNYLKYAHLIYEENRINVESEFQVVIYLNYKSVKGKVRDKVYKKYDSHMFLEIYNEYKKIKEEREIFQISSKIERSVMTESMRYDVFKRDGFKCQICGATSKDGAILHVDHIIPVSKGGKTEMSNLQTLCSRCNVGKSDKL